MNTSFRMAHASYRKLRWSMASLLFPALLSAQVSLYEFSQSQGTYTPITDADGGLTLGVPAYWPHVNNNRAWVNNPFNDPDGQVTMSGYLNPASGPGYPIGFDFTFNGDVFDRIGISNGGWISFGKSTDGLSAVWVYNWSGTMHGDPLIQSYNAPTPNYKRNRVAGFGNSSLQQVDWSSLAPPGQRSKLRVATIGTAPNRVCVVQWEDYGLRNDVTVAMNKINFQIRLNENGNTVEVVFGPQDWVSSLGRYKRTQSGLGGRTSADFNGRMTVYEQPAFLYDWNNTVAADTMTDFCQFEAPQPFQPNGSGIPPVEGLTWRWTAPVCPPPAWPQAISDISFDAAFAQWEASPAGEYEYLVSTGNTPDGPVVSNDITTDQETFLFGLEPMTQYYFFIRSICGGEPGPWSMPTPFRTNGGGLVNCDGTALDVTYCSLQNDSIVWQYISGDGSPLKIEFFSGYRGQVTGESFKVWDGVPSTSNPPIYSLPIYGNPGGISLTASNTGIFTIILVTHAGACEAQSWYLPFEWRVGCKNCNDPLVNFTVQEDCANLQYYVKANIFNLGSSSSLVLNNSLGLPSLTVSSTGEHLTGPFPAGQSVVIVAQNPDNVMCHTDSPALINEPCAVQDCGPTTYTYCYSDNEQSQWAYQGEGNSEIGVRFIRGSVGLGDHLRVYDGLDLDVNPIDNTSGLANKLFTSSTADHAVVLALQSDNAVSCADEDPLFGASQEWEYVVACYDGCIQPKATFSTACVSTTQYEILVNVTDIGSPASVQITNNGGAATVNATATGTYHVGPFNAGTPVAVEVVGASILCTWTSSALVKDDCSDFNIGITENAAGALRLFPNPSSGLFTLEIPATMAGINHLRVLDITGRTVTGSELSGSGTHHLDLSSLPGGLYHILVENDQVVLQARINIQH